MQSGCAQLTSSLGHPGDLRTDRACGLRAFVSGKLRLEQMAARTLPSTHSINQCTPVHPDARGEPATSPKTMDDWSQRTDTTACIIVRASMPSVSQGGRSRGPGIGATGSPFRKPAISTICIVNRNTGEVLWMAWPKTEPAQCANGLPSDGFVSATAKNPDEWRTADFRWIPQGCARNRKTAPSSLV
jgi:hypothetical protein